MRISFDILLVLSLLVAPFFVTATLALGSLIFFPRYVEFVVLALLAELTYRGGDIHILGILLPLTIVALLLFLFAEFVKAFIRTRMI